MESTTATAVEWWNKMYTRFLFLLSSTDLDAWSQFVNCIYVQCVYLVSGDEDDDDDDDAQQIKNRFSHSSLQ